MIRMGSGATKATAKGLIPKIRQSSSLVAATFVSHKAVKFAPGGTTPSNAPEKESAGACVDLGCVEQKSRLAKFSRK